ncbi:MAG: leucine-rich repeat protein, partial [Butyrivibrio sp.]|nr:leucine-rich repeat protein [Butyrivibrio sp.]
MKRNIRNAALRTLSAFLFLETAAGYPAVAFAAEEEMAASFSVSEESQEEAENSSEESAQEEETAADSAGTSENSESSAVNEENGADESAVENETSDSSREEAASDGDSSFDEEGASLASSEELSGEITEEDLIIEEETYEDKLMNRDHASGYCGDDVTWEYDKAQKLLTISGNGAMYDYSRETPAPWSRYVNFITNVEVCEGVTHLGAYSFWTDETKRMKSTVISVFDEEEEDIPPSYTESEGLFRFSKVTLPVKSLTSIGEAAFANIYLDDYCTVTIPETVTELPRRAFYRLDGDYYDSAVVLPDSIKIIGEECFADAQSGVDVNMPQKVEIIKDSAFRHNVYFEKLRFPATLKEIGTKAFLGQISLHDVWFEGDAPVIGEKAFISTNCNAFYPKGNKTFTSEKQKLLGKTFKAVCWKEYDGKVVQQVSSGKAGANITFTVDKGNLKFEGTGAMYDYTSDKLPDWAFSKYTNISIDSRITSVGDYCFFRVEARTIDTFPIRLSRVGKYAFCYFKGKFKDNSRTVNIEKVEDNAFQNVDFRHQDSTLVRLDGATYLGKSAFSRSIGCGPAVDISKVTYFGDYALFTGDIAEGSSFSDKVTYIGDGAFLSTRCTGKLKVKLPATLTYLGADVFNYCPYLESEAEIDGKDINFATGVFEDTHVTSVILGTGVKSIAQNAFDFENRSTEIRIKFLGDKPEFIIKDPTDYGDGIIRCYYPAGNTTWTGIREGHKWDSDAHKYDDIKYIPYGNVTVRFHNAKGEISATSSFPADQTVKEPSVDKRGITSGQKFLGWFTDKDVFNETTKWDFSKPVPYTMDLYAGVGKETCTLKLDYGSFLEAEEMTFEKGADIMDVLYEKKDSVSCPNRIIEGWYQDKERKKSVYGSFRIQEDTIVYADWSDEGLYLNLDYCDGGKPGDVYRKFVEYGTDIKANYRQDFFRGWYRDSAYTGEPVENRIKKGDLEPETTLYAKWEIHDSAKIKVTGFDYYVTYT